MSGIPPPPLPPTPACDQNVLQDFLLGTMVGDAIGLPFEGMSGSRVHAKLRNRSLGHRLLPGSEMVSDDTEHALLTLAAWQRSEARSECFPSSLASELRWWFLAVPAGTGLATAKACLRLILRVRPEHSGVRSAGNGPLMRAGILGLLCTTEDQLRSAIRTASRITHADPRCEHAALVLALAAYTLKSVRPDSAIDPRVPFLQAVRRNLPEGPVLELVHSTDESVRRGEPVEIFLGSLGCGQGVSGFVMHTLPAVLHVWMSWPEDYKGGVTKMVMLGGDTDSTAAIVGG